jgi:hypothetical protein
MSTNEETGADPGSKTEDLKTKLMHPMTVTAPTYAFVAAGVVVMALILVAIS